MENNEDKLKEEAEIYARELEIADDTEEIRKAEIKSDGKILHWIKIIIGSILDQVFAVGLALVIFFVFEQILKLAGFQIVSKEEMFLIMYILSNVIYYPLTIELFHGKTLGKKIMTR